MSLRASATPYSILNKDARKKPNKNSGGQNKRKDPGWKYGTQVGSSSGTAWVQCHYCQKVTKGGITRHKQHLIGGHRNAPCPDAPEHVKEEMRENIKKGKRKKMSESVEVNRNQEEEDEAGGGEAEVNVEEEDDEGEGEDEVNGEEDDESAEGLLPVGMGEDEEEDDGAEQPPSAGPSHFITRRSKRVRRKRISDSMVQKLSHSQDGLARAIQEQTSAIQEQTRAIQDQNRIIKMKMYLKLEGKKKLSVTDMAMLEQLEADLFPK